MSKIKYDSIVVGGGIAGLTAATYLAKSGQKVILFEKNDECGGLVSSFSSNGFHFEAGVRALEDAGVIFPMLHDLGIDLDVVKSPVSIGVENEILNIKDITSLQAYKDMLIKLYPESESDIIAIIKIIRKIMKHMDVLYGIENPVFKDLKRDTSFIFKQLLPWLPRFIFTIGKINRMNMPIEDYLESLIQDGSLRDIISQHFFKKTPTFFALSYFSLYLDYFYPKGGVGKIVEKLQGIILEHGGEIKFNNKITKVLAQDHVVVDENDESYGYDDMIWCADLKTLYRVTDTKGLDHQILQKFKESEKQINGNRGGDSVFSLFLEVDEPLETFSKIANGHFFYTPSKLGLGETHRSELKALLDNWEKVSKVDIKKWLKKFTTLNTYEISIPGLKDSTLVPPNKTGMIVSFLAEHEIFKKMRESDWFDEFKTELEENVIHILSKSVYPMLKEKVENRFSFTPLSIENRVGSSDGAITGWSFEKPIPVVHKIQFSDKSVLTPIPSIYQAGQWAFSPAGVPMSILTGKLAVDRVLKNRK